MAVAKEQVKPKRGPMEEIRSRWTAPPLPNLGFSFANQNLTDLLKGGKIVRFEETTSDVPSDRPDVPSDESDVPSDRSDGTSGTSDEVSEKPEASSEEI